MDAENVQLNEMMPSNLEPDFDEEFEKKLELGEDIVPSKASNPAPTQVCSATMLMGDRSHKELLELLAQNLLSDLRSRYGLESLVVSVSLGCFHPNSITSHKEKFKIVKEVQKEISMGISTGQ